MDLFGMGMGEILLILVVALLIWGPGKLPEIARTLGKMVSTLRKASLDFTTQFKKELEEEEKKTSTPLPKADNESQGKKQADGDAVEDSNTEKPGPKDE
jgi:sec-independent protein translocase protein TatA